MIIQGLHHITLVCADAQRTVDFYTFVLGQRLVKKTVNFDDPDSYHLYFGDSVGRPGTAITFFEWAGVPRGRTGIGGTHHLALIAPNRTALLKWKRRLSDLGVRAGSPVNRRHFFSIYLNDPDGALLEIATPEHGPSSDLPAAPGAAVPLGAGVPQAETQTASEMWPEPIPEITPDMALQHGMHHITAISSDIQRTEAFWSGLLGLPRVTATEYPDDPEAETASWSVGPGNFVGYLQRDPLREQRMRMGPGQTHHFALAVADEATQDEWRDRLLRAGLSVTPTIDRVYFKSIYFHDPDGHILEMATLGPGFLIDEPEGSLGRRLQLPPWLESRRAAIERRLRPIALPDWRVPATEVEVR